MKNFILLPLLFSTLLVTAQADAITRFFKNYADDERFTSVYISPKMFQLVSKIKIDDMDQDLLDVLKTLKGLHILSTEVNPQAFYKEAISKINVPEYEQLMKVRDKGEDVLFLTKYNTADNSKLDELLMLVGDEEEFTLVSFIGNIDLNKIGKLGRALKIDGSEHLDKLPKKN